MSLIAIFVALLFFYSLVSARMERSVVTAPMIFTTAGFVVHLILREIPAWGGNNEFFLHLAELGLVLLLFSDASRTNLKVLRSIRNLPVRLLSVGMLLTLLLGTLAALGIFPSLTIWEAGILAAILAPTDAGLGQVIVNSKLVPTKIREALSVEAGLNDGLAVPFLLFFIGLASSTGQPGEEARLVHLIVEQLGFGVLVGAGIGLAGGALLNFARQRGLMAESFLQLGVVALPLMCGALSEAVSASMFIAAFVAGLAVQVGFKDAGRHSIEFAEEWGQSVNLSVFFLFGLMLTVDIRHFALSHVLYAVLSLTLVRMLPTMVALAGTRLNSATVLFMGWFGPRGLASIVLGLVYLEHQTGESGQSDIRLAVTVTVLFSIFAHGLSAMPGTRRYADRLSTLAPDVPELQVSGKTGP